MRLPSSVLALLIGAACGAPPVVAPAADGLRAPGWVSRPSWGWDAEQAPLLLHATGRAPLSEDAAIRAREAGLATLAERVHAGLQALARVAPTGAPAVDVDRMIAEALDQVAVRGRYRDERHESVWLVLDLRPALLDPWLDGLSGRADAQEAEAVRRRATEALEGLVARWNRS